MLRIQYFFHCTEFRKLFSSRARYGFQENVSLSVDISPVEQSELFGDLVDSKSSHRLLVEVAEFIYILQKTTGGNPDFHSPARCPKSLGLNSGSYTLKLSFYMIRVQADEHFRRFQMPANNVHGNHVI